MNVIPFVYGYGTFFFFISFLGVITTIDEAISRSPGLRFNAPRHGFLTRETKQRRFFASTGRPFTVESTFVVVV